MKQEHEFRKENAEQHQAATHQHQQESTTTGLTFESTEEMLRFDARQTEVPGRIEERLRESIANSPSGPKKSWWRRMFEA